MSKDRSKIGIVLAKINELCKEGLLPEDFRVTNFCFRQNPDKPEDRGYIWVDGRSGKKYFHWQGTKDVMLFCTVYDDSGETVSIWDSSSNRIREIGYLAPRLNKDLDINMSNLVE